MISSNNYYDLIHNRVTNPSIGCSDIVDEDIKILNYPGVLQNIYYITKDGRIYSVINDCYISWSIRDKLPYITLSCMSESKFHLEPFYIKDLVAYNYIANANDYLERGYHAVNIDGDTMNCNYNNIIYLNSSR